jgi:ferredoxin
MDSVASGLIEAFKYEFSGEVDDWDRIASGMYLYGSGGISCWGTLCGIPNGATAATCLLRLHGSLGSDILGHYASTEWPPSTIRALYDHPYYGSGGTGGYSWPIEPMPDDEVLAFTVSNSPLCHVSISKWCFAAGVDLNDQTGYGKAHKDDRCGKIAAEMAGFTAELINYWAQNGTVEYPYSVSQKVAECKTCHWKVSDPYSAAQHPAQCGLMECTECHPQVTNEIHSGRQFIVEDVWTSDPTDHSNSPYSENAPVDTFSANDPIRYNVRFGIMSAASSYVTTYKCKAKGPTAIAKWKTPLADKDATLSPGPTTWSWDETVPSDAVSGTAKVIMKLKLFDYINGHELGLWKRVHKFIVS